MSRQLSGICAGAAAGIAGALLGAGLWASPAEDIRDIRGPKVLLDDWLLPAFILGLATIALAIYGVWRWRRKRRARVLSSHEIALQRLEEIRTLMQPARAREFSTAASDIVRSYIEQRFDVTATRRTTEEFLRDLLEAPNASLALHQSLLGEFLQQCDFVKFAAMSLSVQNMESLRESARAFILATIARGADESAVREARDALPTA